MSITRRKVIAATGLMVGAVWIALLFIQALGNRTIRFVSGQHIVGGPLPGRSHENLPAVAVESGKRLCCRMLYCDFRFPLPPGARVVSIDPVTGGFDTIKGSILVTNTGGGAFDLRAYARMMRRDGFNEDGGGFGFSASSPDGGYVAVQNSGLTCTIGFSFLGDY